MAFEDTDIRTQGNRLIVAVERGAQDWAAYEGAFDYDDPTGLWMQVVRAKHHGDKLGRDEAERLFHDWAERLEYRL